MKSIPHATKIGALLFAVSIGATADTLPQCTPQQCLAMTAAQQRELYLAGIRAGLEWAAGICERYRDCSAEIRKTAKGI